jgi:NADPH2:quinone reductase
MPPSTTRTQNLRDELKALTEGKGPDVIYDPVGGDLTEQAFRSIAWRGRLPGGGLCQWPIPSLPLNLALLKGASIVGRVLGRVCPPRATRPTPPA